MPNLLFFFYMPYYRNTKKTSPFFLLNKLSKLLEKWDVQITLFNRILVVCERIYVKYHTFMIVSLVFSVCTKIWRNLEPHTKNDFWQNKLLLQNAQLCMSKWTNCILMDNYFEGTRPVRRVFVVRVVNS